MPLAFLDHEHRQLVAVVISLADYAQGSPAEADPRVLVVAFAATWLALPAHINGTVSPPASWFAKGLTYHVEGRPYVELDTLEQRIEIAYASAAVVIVLLGPAFGAARRR